MTLPCSPTTSELESSKNLLAMKPDVETNVETRELPVVETSCVETSGLETQPSLTTDNPPSLSMDTFNPDLSVTKTNNNEILEKTQLKRNNMCQSETHAGQQMEETRETTLDAAQSAETNNTDIPTLPLTVQTETETNNDDIVSKETTKQIALPAAKENSPSLIITPAHEPTDHSTATTESTKKIDSQPIIKTRACTVRLEILTKSDIVKRVHIHRKTDASRTSVETVETKTDRHEGTPNTRNTITRSSRQPRSVNKVVDYSDMVSDDNKSLSPPHKKQHHNRPRREPSKSRIKSDSFTTKQPVNIPLRHSPRISASPVTSSPNPGKTLSPPNPEINTLVSSSNKKSTQKGTFETQSFHLKRSKRAFKFSCKLCTVVCASTKELIQHHQQKHNILYCDACSKAFNNPSSLARHKYTHKELKFKCSDCDQQFAFESNLQMHRVSHRTIPSHCCVYPNCQRKFKNKGDLTRHAKEHDGIVHKCPDCQYENSDVRNLESHRLRHSAIEKYACQLCGQTFRYSNQRHGHINDRKCPKRSSSPEH